MNNQTRKFHRGCPGEYEDKAIIHTIRHYGQIVVIDSVPAEVCNICGDSILAPETVARIEKLLESGNRPIRTVPLYNY